MLLMHAMGGPNWATSPPPPFPDIFDFAIPQARPRRGEGERAERVVFNLRMRKRLGRPRCQDAKIESYCWVVGNGSVEGRKDD